MRSGSQASALRRDSLGKPRCPRLLCQRAVHHASGARSSHTAGTTFTSPLGQWQGTGNLNVYVYNQNAPHCPGRLLKQRSMKTSPGEGALESPFIALLWRKQGLSGTSVHLSQERGNGATPPTVPVSEGAETTQTRVPGGSGTVAEARSFPPSFMQIGKGACSPVQYKPTAVSPTQSWKEWVQPMDMGLDYFNPICLNPAWNQKVSPLSGVRTG